MEVYTAVLYNDIQGVRYETDNKNGFDWIIKYFSDYYSISAETDKQQIDYVVKCFMMNDESLFDDYNRNNTKVQGFFGGEYFVDASCEVIKFVACDKSHIIKKEKNTISMYINNVRFEIVHISARIIRDIFTRAFENVDYNLLHSGAVSCNGFGLLFVGSKNAGKTTAVFSTLKHSRASFISNDKTYIGFNKKNEAIMHGWPASSLIAINSLNSFSEILNYIISETLEYPQFVKDEKNIKIELTPNEIKSIYKINILKAQKLDFVFFPCIDPKVNKTSIFRCPIEKSRQIMLNNLLTPYDPHYPDFLHLRKKDEDFYRTQAEKTVDKILSSIKCYELNYGYDIKEMANSLSGFIHEMKL